MTTVKVSVLRYLEVLESDKWANKHNIKKWRKVFMIQNMFFSLYETVYNIEVKFKGNQSSREADCRCRQMSRINFDFELYSVRARRRAQLLFMANSRFSCEYDIIRVGNDLNIFSNSFIITNFTKCEQLRNKFDVREEEEKKFLRSVWNLILSMMNDIFEIWTKFSIIHWTFYTLFC